MRFNVAKSFDTAADCRETNLAILSVFAPRLELGIDVDEQADEFQLTGFNDHLGGINYRVTCDFTRRAKGGKTSLYVDVSLTPSVWFFVFLGLCLFGGGFWIVLPIGFYYYGRTLVTRRLERGLDEIEEMLTPTLWTTTPKAEPVSAPQEPVQDSLVSIRGQDVADKLRRIHLLEQEGILAPEEVQKEKARVLVNVTRSVTDQDSSDFLAPLAALISEKALSKQDVDAFKAAYASIKKVGGQIRSSTP